MAKVPDKKKVYSKGRIYKSGEEIQDGLVDFNSTEKPAKKKTAEKVPESEG